MMMAEQNEMLGHGAVEARQTYNRPASSFSLSSLSLHPSISMPMVSRSTTRPMMCNES